ncbi:heavy-metal-associated domain-containing protein [Bacteroidota bacterium]
MTDANYKVEGMSCKHCVKAVEMEMKKLPLESFQVEIGSVTATFDETKLKSEEIENTIREAGYQIVI